MADTIAGGGKSEGVMGTAGQLGWDDYRSRAAEPGVRREILGGVWAVSPAPGLFHQAVALELGMRIRVFATAHDLGLALVAPVGVLLGERDIVEPDVIFLARDRVATLEANRVLGPPEIVVEVLAPSTRRTDLLRKRRLYSRAGVPEYWVADPDAESLTRFRREGAEFRAEAAVFADPPGVIETPLLPGFSLDVGDLFRAARAGL